MVKETPKKLQPALMLLYIFDHSLLLLLLLMLFTATDVTIYIYIFDHSKAHGNNDSCHSEP